MKFNHLLYIFTSFLFIMESCIHLNIFSVSSKKKLSNFYIIPNFILTLIPCLTFYLPHLSLTIFYLSWLAICLLQERLSISQYNRITDYGKIRFLIFSSIHLCVIGAISLLTTYTITEIIENPSIMLSCTTIAMILFIVMKFVLITVDENFHFVLCQEQKKDFRSFYHFLHLSIYNILIQSCLCSIKLSLESAVAYLLCCNFVSLLLMANYIINLGMIFQVEHAESSFFALSSSLTKANSRIKQLKSNVLFDELTHAYSRVYLMQEATRLLDSKTLFSIVYIDLNRLKKINDTYGHKAGDAYLCDFVSAMQENVRKGDIIARFGGDEFVLLMPNCSKSNAIFRIQSIKDKFKNNDKKFLFSAGIVDSRETSTLDALISLADERMYKEKLETRRNR